MKINENFSLLRSNYLFSTMSRKIKDYKIAHPETDIIDLGIGDVSRPLPEACIKAMHSAVNEMADAATFRGYPPEHGYDFLIDKILKYDFAAHGIALERD
ncbi:MAG: LL-diaminopimelate aminotransferase, partial [Oscillospiraceae bacterium]|nr:LL-diaminopimelate aminotransferase [Oscillospiraceae bacterium]MDY5580866.1 LL-diaminopimelate aminotransferase [Oscillospiraceae bacterium]